MAPAVDAFSLSFHTSNECGLRYEHRTALVLLRILAAATPIPTCGLRCVGRESRESLGHYFRVILNTFSLGSSPLPHHFETEP